MDDESVLPAAANGTIECWQGDKSWSLSQPPGPSTLFQQVPNDLGTWGAWQRKHLGALCQYIWTCF